MFFKTDQQFILNESTSPLGKSSAIIYFFLYVLGSILILSNTHNFPDYYVYDAYIQKGTASIRFIFEPISALVMTTLHHAKLGAQAYYLFTWFFSSTVLFLTVFFVGKRYLSFIVFLLFNPINIVMFQTPRQFLGFCFFVAVLMLSTKFKFKFLFSLFSLLSHSISGVLSFFFLFLLKVKKYLIPFILACGAIGFYFIAQYKYSIHLEDNGEKRGMGRLLLFVFQTVIIVFLTLKKPLIDKCILVIILFFIFYLYQITPIAGRVLPFFSAFIFLYAYKSFKKFDSILIMHTLMLSNIFLSFLIIILGLFNFGGG